MESISLHIPMLRRIYYILFLTSVLLGSGTLLQLGYSYFQPVETYNRHPRDTYDPSLGRLSDLKKLENYIDSLASEKGLIFDSIPEYINLADSIVRMRFYYGLQNYRFADNFIANIMAKYIWYPFGAKVLPDDILKGQKAYCSQSSIVFQEFLKRKGFDVRSVFLSNHFCTEVLVNGNWQFHDVSYKPELAAMGSLSAEDLLANPQYLEQAYLYTFAESFRDNLHVYFNYRLISYGQINAFAAPKMLIFHRVTYFLSWWGWLFFLCLALLWRRIFIKKLND